MNKYNKDNILGIVFKLCGYEYKVNKVHKDGKVDVMCLPGGSIVSNASVLGNLNNQMYEVVEEPVTSM